MGHQYNASLSWGRRRYRLLVTSTEWGWESVLKDSQNKKRKTVYTGWETQNALQVSGTCYSAYEYRQLTKFIRDWHIQACNSPNPSLMRFCYYGKNAYGKERNFDYLVVPSRVEDYSKWDDFAPAWNFQFDIVRDMLSPTTGTLSHTINKWFWEAGYRGTLVNIEEGMELLDGTDIIDANDPDAQFGDIHNLPEK